MISLSNVEYLVYCDCPLKFYLIKDSSNGIWNSDGLNDYSVPRENIENDILWHSWFKSFHTIYYNCIKNTDRPFDNSPLNNVHRLFYDFELQRYKQNSEFWFPIAKEVFIQNDYYKGVIDRVDQLDETGNFRIINYKSRPSQYDEKELFFYSVLLSHEKDSLGWFPDNGQIRELAVYYYTTGEFKTIPISEKNIVEFESQLYNLLKEILRPNFKRKKGCNYYSTNCPYKEICKRIPL